MPDLTPETFWETMTPGERASLLRTWGFPGADARLRARRDWEDLMPATRDAVGEALMESEAVENPLPLRAAAVRRGRLERERARLAEERAALEERLREIDETLGRRPMNIYFVVDEETCSVKGFVVRAKDEWRARELAGEWGATVRYIPPEGPAEVVADLDFSFRSIDCC